MADKRIAEYGTSARVERDHLDLACYARDHHLAEMREARERGDAEAEGHHRAEVAILAKTIRAARARLEWYEKAIAALKRGEEAPRYSAALTGAA